MSSEPTSSEHSSSSSSASTASTSVPPAMQSSAASNQSPARAHQQQPSSASPSIASPSQSQRTVGLHRNSSTSKQLCRRWPNCRFGRKCHFFHPYDQPQQQQQQQQSPSRPTRPHIGTRGSHINILPTARVLCRFHPHCKRGADCHFFHPPSSSEATPQPQPQHESDSTSDTEENSKDTLSTPSSSSAPSAPAPLARSGSVMQMELPYDLESAHSMIHELRAKYQREKRKVNFLRQQLLGETTKRQLVEHDQARMLKAERRKLNFLKQQLHGEQEKNKIIQEQTDRKGKDERSQVNFLRQQLLGEQERSRIIQQEMIQKLESEQSKLNFLRAQLDGEQVRVEILNRQMQSIDKQVRTERSKVNFLKQQYQAEKKRADFLNQQAKRLVQSEKRKLAFVKQQLQGEREKLALLEHEKESTILSERRKVLFLQQMCEGERTRAELLQQEADQQIHLERAKLNFLRQQLAGESERVRYLHRSLEARMISEKQKIAFLRQLVEAERQKATQLQSTLDQEEKEESDREEEEERLRLSGGAPAPSPVVAAHATANTSVSKPAPQQQSDSRPQQKPAAVQSSVAAFSSMPKLLYYLTLKGAPPSSQQAATESSSSSAAARVESAAAKEQATSQVEPVTSQAKPVASQVEPATSRSDHVDRAVKTETSVVVTPEPSLMPRPPPFSTINKLAYFLVVRAPRLPQPSPPPSSVSIASSQESVQAAAESKASNEVAASSVDASVPPTPDSVSSPRASKKVSKSPGKKSKKAKKKLEDRLDHSTKSSTHQARGSRILLNDQLHVEQRRAQQFEQLLRQEEERSHNLSEQLAELREQLRLARLQSTPPDADQPAAQSVVETTSDASHDQAQGAQETEAALSPATAKRRAKLALALQEEEDEKTAQRDLLHRALVTPRASSSTSSASSSTSSSASSIASDGCLLDHTTQEELDEITEDGSSRMNVAREILQIEEHYVENLEKVVRVFQTPLLESMVSPSPILTNESISLIFCTTMTLLKNHRAFLQSLHDRIAEWEETSPEQRFFGDIYDTLITHLVGYQQYINNYPHAVAEVNKLRKSNLSFAKFLRSPKVRKSVGSFDLVDFLILPIQQISRYVLLSKELIRQTPKDHKDYQKIVQNVRKLEDHVQKINEMTRTSEEGSKIASLQERLSGADFKLLTPTRRLIMEGELMLKTSGKVRDTKKLNYFILFNDILVMARPRRTTKKEREGSLPNLIYRNSFPLGHLTLDQSRTAEHKSSKSFAVCLLLDTTYHKGSSKQLTLLASSEAEQHRWESALYAAIKRHLESSLSATSLEKRLARTASVRAFNTLVRSSKSAALPTASSLLRSRS
eukprot:CAMPEP_0177657646 /NCGR_PEP_ID=MMETSP0447-20121125/16317_1 /TAXON_ID=0 /ORGANISM="Stygamoeba regulata, Strain BSH-02190019" /LENGTH=1333 /DNA_ID=CAMNT_0019162057 /DNA_START=60 /DNA_END=4057 /DNA_ORIENTATION=+